MYLLLKKWVIFHYHNIGFWVKKPFLDMVENETSSGEIP